MTIRRRARHDPIGADRAAQDRQARVVAFRTTVAAQASASTIGVMAASNRSTAVLSTQLSVAIPQKTNGFVNSARWWLETGNILAGHQCYLIFRRA